MSKGLTRERIVAAALDVLDERGADGVTVRAVAARLDVRAPALYWHVRDKQELLDEMGTEIQRRVSAGFRALDAGLPLREALAGYARILRAEYLRHRDGARTFSGTRITDPEVLRAMEPWLERWSAAGGVAAAVDAAELLVAFVVGFVIEEQERAGQEEGRYSVRERDAMLGDGAPLVREVGHVRDAPDVRFERQLGILLDGLDARGR